jgi:hypothetical protein
MIASPEEPFTPQAAQETLAYMRAIVAPGEGFQRGFGQAYLAAGLCYGGQLIGSGLQSVGRLPGTPTWNLALGVAPTAVFLAILAWVIVRSGRRGGMAAGGVAARVTGVVFGAFGLTNLALLVVVGSVAARLHSLTVWLIYPCAVYVLQGTAWLIAYAVRRRGWHLLVAAGWIACALVMAAFIEVAPVFILAAGVGMIACMVAPGWAMIRAARQAG